MVLLHESHYCHYGLEYCYTMKLPAVMLINIQVIMGNLVFNITMLLKLFVVIMIHNTVILLNYYCHYGL